MKSPDHNPVMPANMYALSRSVMINAYAPHISEYCNKREEILDSLLKLTDLL
jgi:hypothetical protein